MTWKKKDSVIIGIGVASVFLGVLINLYWQDVFEKVIYQVCTLKSQHLFAF